MQWDQWCRGDQSLFSWQISRSVSPGKVAKIKWRSQSYAIDFYKWWWFLFHLQSVDIMNPECPVWGIFEEPVFKEKIPGKAVITIPYRNLTLHIALQIYSTNRNKKQSNSTTHFIIMQPPWALNFNQSWSVLSPHQITNAWQAPPGKHQHQLN